MGRDRSVQVIAIHESAPNRRVKVVLDAMGGDYAPAVVVEGGIRAAQSYDVDVIFVGREDAVRAELARHDAAGLPVSIVHAGEVIEMHERPAVAVRAKKDSSMVVGMDLIKSGQADALVSIGNTGGILAAALLHLGRVPGIRRPALSTIFPTMSGFCLLLDIGANANCKPEYLLQFAVMGSVYSQLVLGVANPRVGLVSNGEEEAKGNILVQEAHALLKTAPGLNFIGNVEGKEVMRGEADVVVTDGFTGNIIIKFAEGVAATIKEIIRQEIYHTPLSRVGGLLARSAFERMGKRIDYTEYGGAPLLGVQGVVIVGHGRSNARAVHNAVRVAMQGVRGGMLEAIRDGVNRVMAPLDSGGVPEDDISLGGPGDAQAA
jgi:glycerol-3-phosphate acyltransferase PlsX